MEESAAIQQQSWFQDAMKKGFILGIIHIVIFLVIYAAFPSKLTGFSYLFLILALNIGYTIYQGILWRKQTGGYMEFGVAFKYTFILLLFNGIINTLFTIIFLFIDPQFPELMAQSQLDTSMYWAQKFGAPDNVLEQMRDSFKAEDVTKRFSISGILMSFGVIVILYAVGALIAGLIVRKRAPETF